MAVEGRSATQKGDILFISLIKPYENISSIESYQDEISGEDTYNFFYKYFRWSIDNKFYSDWIILTNDNLQELELDSTKPFWIQYKYEVESISTGNTLTFESISLETITTNGSIVDIPCVEYCNGDDCAPNETLIIDDCCPEAVFDPYANLQNARSNYNQLSCLVGTIFGLPVRYYKQNPKSDSRDVIFKEYSLYNVKEVDDLKVVVPNNEFPSREIHFSQLDMEVPDMFEVHIIKTHFEAAFGKGERPGQGDAIWFPMIDRMFEINSIALPNASLYETPFYKVNLTDWQDRQNRDYEQEEAGPEIREEIDSIIDSTEERFKEEKEEEIIKVRKANQYNTLGTNDKDYIRKEIDIRLKINDNQIRNNYTVISKYQYDLSSITKDSIAAIYRYNKGITVDENRAFTMWIKSSSRISYNSLVIENIESDINNNTVFQLATNDYVVGDIVRITGTQDYNGIHRIIAVNSNKFTISTIYITNVRINARSRKYEYCKYLQYSDKFEIGFIKDAFIININNYDYYFDLKAKDFQILTDNWYGIVINFSNTFKQLSLFVYEIEKITGTGAFNIGSTLKNSFTETKQLNEKYIITDGLDWKLISCPIELTNIRIFKSPIEEEEQSLILNQYVVADTHLSEIVDNAMPGIRLARKANNR